MRRKFQNCFCIKPHTVWLPTRFFRHSGITSWQKWSFWMHTLKKLIGAKSGITANIFPRYLGSYNNVHNCCRIHHITQRLHWTLHDSDDFAWLPIRLAIVINYTIFSYKWRISCFNDSLIFIETVGGRMCCLLSSSLHAYLKSHTNVLQKITT